MANTGNTPRFDTLTRGSINQPLGPGSIPQKEVGTTSGSDLQDDQHQPAQSDLPLNAGEPLSESPQSDEERGKLDATD